MGQQPEHRWGCTDTGRAGLEFYSLFDEKPRQAELSAPLRTLYFKPNPKHIFFSHIISSNNMTQLQEQFFAHIRNKLIFSYHFCSSSCAPLNSSCICINDSFCLHAFPVCLSPAGISTLFVSPARKRPLPFLPPCSCAPIALHDHHLCISPPPQLH